jgi:hypothetical protein
MMTLRSAVALFVYNRTTFLPAILDAIQAAHPTKLYIFGDGPKDDSEDRARCADVRRIINDREWRLPIDVTFALTNLGCSGRVVSGIDEIFLHEEQAIFLEDDIEPSQSFFPYCDWLLETFAHHEQVAMISGINPLSKWPIPEASCFFSKFGNAPAWATWRRAWRHYSSARQLWASPQNHAAIADFLSDPEIFAWRAAIYGQQDQEWAWDFQWALARHARRALCAVPVRSLATHCGCGPAATNVKRRSILDVIAERYEIAAPFRAPATVTADDAFDRLYFEVTQNKISVASAEWLAERLMARGRNLLAIAILRHALANSPPGFVTETLIEEAFSRAQRLSAHSG